MVKILTFLVIMVSIMINHPKSFVESCDANKFIKTEYMELKNHTVQTIRRIFLELCWGECMSLPWCLSINSRNISESVYECDLNKSNKTAAGGLVPNPTSDYYEIAIPGEKICKLYNCDKKEQRSSQIAPVATTSSITVTSSPLSSSTVTTTSTLVAAPTTSPTTATSACQLDFPRSSQDDYFEILPRFSQDIEELSLSFWLKVPSSYKNNLAIVSYRTKDETSDMSVVIKDTSEVEFKINGGGKKLKSNFVRDNTWQNIAISIAAGGKVKSYRNGNRLSSESGMNQGKIKKDAEGKVQLGKIFDGDDSSIAIQGSLAEVYMWDNALSNDNIDNIFKSNCGSMGDIRSNALILSWGTILNSNGLKGQVKKTCPATCPG